MTLNRRTGSGSNLAGSLHSTSTGSMASSLPMSICPFGDSVEFCVSAKSLPVLRLSVITRINHRRQIRTTPSRASGSRLPPTARSALLQRPKTPIELRTLSWHSPCSPRLGGDKSAENYFTIETPRTRRTIGVKFGDTTAVVDSCETLVSLC